MTVIDQIRDLKEKDLVSKNFQHYLICLNIILYVNEMIETPSKLGDSKESKNYLARSTCAVEEIARYYDPLSLLSTYGIVGKDDHLVSSGHLELVEYAAEMHNDSVKKMLEGLLESVESSEY